MWRKRCAGQLPAKRDLLRVAALGLCLYFNQLFYIIGIDLSGVVVATCMQPTIPVFTAMIAPHAQRRWPLKRGFHPAARSWETYG